MVKVKLIKDTVKQKKGNISNWSKKSAEHLVSQGFGEYVEEVEVGRDSRTKTTKESKKVKISTGREQKREFWISDGEKTYLDINAFVDFMIEKYHFQTIFYTKGEKVFAYINGVYQPNGRALIKTVIESELGYHPKLKNYHVNEILEKIKRKTSILQEQFETVPEFKICLENGILDLKTQTVEEHDPEYFFQSKIPVYYDSETKCPKIIKFLEETFYPEHLKLIQEWLGFNLCGRYFLKKAVIYFGERDTGKTTLLNLQIAFLGRRNIAGINLQKISQGHSFAISSLKNKYANIVDDLDSKDISDSGGFKMATGGGYLTGEYKFGDTFQFLTFAKHTFSCNKIPALKDVDEAYYSRWMPIPLDAQVGKPDPFLLDKLTTKEELSGLLNWVLEGLRRLLQNGKFSYSKNCFETKQIMERNSSPLSAFVQDALIQENDFRIDKPVMYEIFCSYCNILKLPVLSKNQFSRNLRKYATYITESQDSVRYWKNASIDLNKLKRLYKYIDTFDTLKNNIYNNFNVKENKGIFCIYMFSKKASNKSKKDSKKLDTFDTSAKKDFVHKEGYK
jgi:P4 family phage/plasmid primase-like protien